METTLLETAHQVGGGAGMTQYTLTLTVDWTGMETTLLDTAHQVGGGAGRTQYTLALTVDWTGAEFIPHVPAHQVGGGAGRTQYTLTLTALPSDGTLAASEQAALQAIHAQCAPPSCLPAKFVRHRRQVCRRARMP